MQAHVQLRDISGPILAFSVFNDSPYGMAIARDEVYLETKRGLLSRVPGGAAATYSVPPGGAHDVKVKFDLSELEDGEEVRVRWDRALLVGGAPVAIPPVRFVVRR